jgi:hypothetical protein
VVAKLRESPAVNKQRSHRFHVERFNLKELNEAEGKKQYCIEVSDRFRALEDLNTRWKLIVPGKLLQRISKFQPKRV